MSDGERFRLYRQATIDGLMSAKGEILKSFSKSKQDLVTRFERFELSHKELSQALDDLMPFEGLWADIQVGNLGRVCNLRMPEVRLVHRCDSDMLTIAGVDHPSSHDEKRGVGPNYRRSALRAPQRRCADLAGPSSCPIVGGRETR